MIIVPAILEGISTLKDGTIKLVYETQELRPVDVGVLFSYRNACGFLAFNPANFNKDEVDILEGLKASEFDGEKSDSKRMRNVLFRLWEQDKKGYDDFNLFYKYRMNDLISILKNEFNK
jgi:hypothetical protein